MVLPAGGGFVLELDCCCCCWLIAVIPAEALTLADVVTGEVGGDDVLFKLVLVPLADTPVVPAELLLLLLLVLLLLKLDLLLLDE